MRNVSLRATVVAASSLLVASVASAQGWDSGAGASNVSQIAVYGDSPYGTTPTDTAEFLASPAFIDSINADSQVSFVAHVGDIHSGKQFCTQAYDESIANLWQAYQKPLVYTPGD